MAVPITPISMNNERTLSTLPSKDIRAKPTGAAIASTVISSDSTLP